MSTKRGEIIGPQQQKIKIQNGVRVLVILHLLSYPDYENEKENSQEICRIVTYQQIS
jgi:hypothetical protein